MENFKICRTCQSEKELMFIFDEENEELVSFFHRIASIMITADDALPQYICNLCANTIQVIHKFIHECKETDRILRSSLHRFIKIEPKESPAKSVFSKIEPVGNKNDTPLMVTSFVKNDPQLPLNPHQEVVQQHQLNDKNMCMIHLSIENVIKSNDEEIAVKVEPIEENVKSALNPPNPYFIVLEDDSEDESTGQYVDETGKCFSLDDIIEFDEDYIEDDYVKLVNYIDEPTEVSKKIDSVEISQPESPNVVKTCDSPTPSSMEISQLDPTAKSPKVENTCDSEIWEPKPARRSKKIRKGKLIKPEPKERKVKVPKTYVCAMCSATFNDCLKYRAHRKEHGTSLYPCKYCPKAFKKTWARDLHQNTHMGVRFPCHLCHSEFSSPHNLSRHIVKVHKGNGTQICENCNLTKFNRKDLEFESYKCEICMATYTTLEELEKHDASHVSKPKYGCLMCDKVFLTPLRLKIHERVHDPNSMYCVCGTKRKPCREVVCEKCGHVCKNRHRYAVHMSGHTDYRPLACTLCPAKFKAQVTLTKHMLCHTNEKPYSCDICGKKFRQSAHLTTHMKSIHAPVSSRQFACKFCDKRHVTLHNLRIHERIHTGERPHVCDICEESFIEAGPLRRHRQKVHLLVEPSKRAVPQVKCNSAQDSNADKLNKSSEHDIDVQGVMDTFNEIVEYEFEL